MGERNGRRHSCRWLAVLTVLPLVAGCSTSSPFSSASGFDRTFIGAAQTWDLDKNGVVSCDEWKQYATSSFRDADTNGDGALDAEEWKRLARNDRLFEVADLKYYDGNGDGRVTPDELAGKPNLAFALLDKNHDCQIDRNETVQSYSIDKPKQKDNTDNTIAKPPGGR
jgi:Ca2+-binding EF-hand superfamily protein